MVNAKALLQASLLAAGKTSGSSIPTGTSEPQTSPSKPGPTKTPHAVDGELKMLAEATGDETWLTQAARWKELPLELRWVVVATQSKEWMGYKSLFEQSPLDLRHIAVATLDHKWLHNCTTWAYTPMPARLLGIARRDPTLARPSVTEVAYADYVNRIEKNIPDDLLPLCPTIKCDHFTSGLHCRGDPKTGPREMTVLDFTVDKLEWMKSRNHHEPGATIESDPITVPEILDVVDWDFRLAYIMPFFAKDALSACLQKGLPFKASEQKNHPLPINSSICPSESVNDKNEHSVDNRKLEVVAPKAKLPPSLKKPTPPGGLDRRHNEDYKMATNSISPNNDAQNADTANSNVPVDLSDSGPTAPRTSTTASPQPSLMPKKAIGTPSPQPLPLPKKAPPPQPLPMPKKAMMTKSVHRFDSPQPASIRSADDGSLDSPERSLSKSTPPETLESGLPESESTAPESATIPMKKSPLPPKMNNPIVARPISKPTPKVVASKVVAQKVAPLAPPAIRPKVGPPPRPPAPRPPLLPHSPQD